MDERTVTMERVSLEEIWAQAHIAKELSCMNVLMGDKLRGRGVPEE